MSRIKSIVLKICPRGTKRWLFIKLVKFSIQHPKTVIRAVFSKKTFTFLRISKSNPKLAGNKMDIFLQNSKTIDHNGKSLIIFNEKRIKQIKMPTSSSPLVSIIIPVYNQFFYTYNCLLAIKKHVEPSISYEIIIADDCSTDKTKKIEKIFTGINVIHNKNNLGFLMNVNNAAKITKGRYIYLLNNDTNPQPHFLSELVEYIENNHNVGIVGSKLVYKNGALQEAGGIVWKDASAWNYGNGQDRSLPEFNYVKEVDYVSGASLLIKKSLWNKIGGFDKRFAPAYYEDTDLCFEARKHGYKVIYIPTSTIVHFEGISNGKDVRTGTKKYQVVNFNKFYSKWGSILKNHCNNGEDVFHSRDRSWNKKTIFMIDHYVPTFDKDAGSRCVYQYLKLLIKMGFNVKFLGDNCMKSEPYATILQKMGIEVYYGYDMYLHWKKYIKNNAKNFDFFFLNRPHISIKYISFIKENTNSKILYFGHDLHSLRLEREYKVTKNYDILKESKKYKEIEHKIFKLSDVIYYPSDIEVKYVKNIDKRYNVHQLQLNIYEYSEYKRSLGKDLLFVGGFAHTPNVDGCIWFVKKVFPIIKSKIPSIKLHIVGSNTTSDILNLSSNNIKVHGYVDDETLKKIHNDCAVFVAPLRYGAGVKGKILEAMHYGMPIVTTSCGAEGIVLAQKGMLIADSPDSFAKNVINLYNSKTKRVALGKSAKNIINKYYTIETAKQIINRDFKN